MLRRCNLRLVKGNGQNLMCTVVADVPDIDEPAIPRLILNVEAPVLGVRQLVVLIVAGEQERPGEVAGRPVARCGLRKIRQNRQKSRSGSRRRRGNGASNGVAKFAPFLAEIGST